MVDVFHLKWHFQRVMKYSESVKELEDRAAAALRELLDELSTIKLKADRIEQAGRDPGPDVVAHIQVDDHRRILVCEVKPSGQPQHVRSGIMQLQRYVRDFPANTTPVFIAPYLSPDAQALCLENGIGYLDFEGNTHIVFDTVFIDRHVDSKPPAERRELRSLFKQRSAQILRALLREPGRSWRVIELANTSGVSLGHVSNVRKALIERAWASVDADGLKLTEPDAVLDAWRHDYQHPAGTIHEFYTTLHGAAFEEAIRSAMSHRENAGRIAFASFSAAQWLAPFARTGTHYFYADHLGLEWLRTTLRFSAAAKGNNVSITVLKDDGLFRDTIEPAPNVFCTSPVQTYLDLSVSGERGQEAADHLRRERLRWST